MLHYYGGNYTVCFSLVHYHSKLWLHCRLLNVVNNLYTVRAWHPTNSEQHFPSKVVLGPYLNSSYVITFNLSKVSFRLQMYSSFVMIL